MRKYRELADTNSCMSKARLAEMTFVLLGRDVAAPSTIRHWVDMRIALGKNAMDDEQIQEALKCADIMDDERTGRALPPLIVEGGRPGICETEHDD